MPLLGSIIKKSLELRNKLKVEERAPIYYQKRELKKLLRKAQFTLFGQTYHFTTIVNSKNFINKFRATVPMHDYSSIFAKWWNKCLHNETNVCWPGQVKYFALSSGTSDSSSKHIPVTREMVKSIKRTSLRHMVTLADYDLPQSIFQKGILALGGRAKVRGWRSRAVASSAHRP